jgi:hypothetical protein
MTATTTLWTKLTRWLGCDGNPLRRRHDRAEAWLLPAAIVVFLALCPLVASVSSLWTRADNAAVRHAALSWVQVPAVLLQAVPGPEQADHGANTWTTWTPASWTFGGRHYTGAVPAAAGTPAGRTVTAYLSRSGQVELPPLTAQQRGARADTATTMTLLVLAVLLAAACAVGRRILDRRRLAGWETAWLAVGPRWSRLG